MLSMLPLDVPAAEMPRHVNELLDRLEDERVNQRRMALFAEFETATPDRKIKILKTLEDLGA